MTEPNEQTLQQKLETKLNEVLDKTEPQELQASMVTAIVTYLKAFAMPTQGSGAASPEGADRMKKLASVMPFAKPKV